MKQSRAFSFIILFIIYLLTTAVGVIFYRLLSFSPWLNLLLADVIATAFIFIFSVVLKNASVYDPYWSVQPLVILLCFAWGKKLSVPQILIMLAVFGWGVRLTANWAYTFRNLTCQDWRYTMLAEKTKKLYPVVNFVGIHLVPTLVVYGCILPAVEVFLLTDLTFSVWSCVFVCLAVGAFTMQGVADVQMHRYRKNRTTPFIRVGLWKYSRHPNYLGEILMWWSIYFACLMLNPTAWYLFVGAFANTLLFVFVSVPLADGRQSRKDGFAEYKAETHIFLPIKKLR